MTTIHPPSTRQRPSQPWCAWLLLASACAAPAEFLRRPPQPISWPSAASTPRVDLQFAYGGTQDAVRHPGFFGWLVSFAAGEREERFVSPAGLTVAGDVLWIADPGAGCVHRVSLATGEHRHFAGSEANPFVTPIGVAALPDGSVFVSDAASSMITMLDADGEPLRSFGGPGVVGRPTGICFDEALGRLLVVDTVGCRLLAFDIEGRQLAATGERGTAPGQFNYPTNLALASDGRVVVVDSLNFRIQVLSSELQPLSCFGRVGRGPGDFSNPKGVAVDSRDNVYVVDSMFDNFQIFDLQGQLLLAVASSGFGLGELYLPTGIHIDRFDRIFVSDAGNSRIQAMQLQVDAR